MVICLQPRNKVIKTKEARHTVTELGCSPSSLLQRCQPVYHNNCSCFLECQPPLPLKQPLPHLKRRKSLRYVTKKLVYHTLIQWRRNVRKQSLGRVIFLLFLCRRGDLESFSSKCGPLISRVALLLEMQNLRPHSRTTRMGIFTSSKRHVHNRLKPLHPHTSLNVCPFLSLIVSLSPSHTTTSTFLQNCPFVRLSVSPLH